MIHFKKFNSRSNGSMKQHHAFSTEGKKTSSDCSNCGMKKKKKLETTTSCKKHQYYACYSLVALQASDTTRQQSNLKFDRLECETTPVCLLVDSRMQPTRTDHTLASPSTCHCCASRAHTCAACTAHEPGSFHGRGQARLCSTAGCCRGERRQDGWQREGAVTVALCSVEGGIDYVYLESCMARHLMEPGDRDELALRMLVRGQRMGAD